MAIIKPFRAIRPAAEYASRVASRPYDVMSIEEARQEAAGNPYSFLHIIRPEINYPAGQDPYAPEVYRKGRENFEILSSAGVLIPEQQDSLYVYRLCMQGRCQTGLVACASVDDYFNGVIRLHELTRPDKEEDRKNHIRVGRIQAEPVFFAYPAQAGLEELYGSATGGDPLFDFTADDGVRHQIWQISDPGLIGRITAHFSRIPHTYVADGHHRTAAAALVGREMREANPRHTGEEPYNYFLAVHFPDNQLQILDYNRVVRDLSGHQPEVFLNKLAAYFQVVDQSDRPVKPDRSRCFGMYLAGKWYRLTAPEAGHDVPGDPVGSLDVTLLSNQVLEPLLGITDLRKDKRIDFVGGIRGLDELRRRVDSGEMAVGFALFPVSMQHLMAIADSGAIMPPKTTWFEPKLRSGLLIHGLEEPEG
jgi:uncharacterized protein (DUF1015 family)